jgi:hypothetical protein
MLVVVEAEKSQLPEAPISITVLAYFEGFQVLITRRTGDLPIVSQIPGLIALITKLEEAGFKPVRMNFSAALPPAENKEVGKEREIPICATHKIPMVWREGTSKTGAHYSFWACPTKNPDGTWCKGKPSKHDS